MHAVVETPSFLQSSKDAGVDSAMREEIVSLVAANPMIGVALRGSGGCRKFRFARSGAGKSGGFRVVHFFSGSDLPVFLLAVFGKNEKGNLSAGEVAMLAAMTRRLIEVHSRASKGKAER